MTIMRFGLLGPLLVQRDGVSVPVRQGKQRAVLAALLLRAGQVVPVDELAEVLWGTGPPPSARVTIQNYVRRLRQALGDVARIGTCPGGYVITVADGELDVSGFQGYLAASRAAARDGLWEMAAAQARAALALWRGEPLVDVPSDLLAVREVPWLAELRLQALEARIEADLWLGRPGEVVAELNQLAAAHPLREQVHGQLMLALYRCGRQAEALAAYQRARAVLIEELGAEPGPGLRDLHQRILVADPELGAAERAPSAGSDGGPETEPMAEFAAQPRRRRGKAGRVRTGVIGAAAVVAAAAGITAAVLLQGHTPAARGPSRSAQVLFRLQVEHSGLYVRYAVVTNLGTHAGYAYIVNTGDGKVHRSLKPVPPGQSWTYPFNRDLKNGARICGFIGSGPGTCVAVHP
jgi:DNA-binding SARP family transcriptional activator